MLLEHNEEVYAEFESMLLETGECCIVADPGIGKSNISMEFIDRYKLNTLVVCPTNALCNEWKANSEKYNVPGIDVTTYQAFSKSFMVLNNFDCYVFDEAHHAGSKKWGASIRRFKETTDAFVIGLTATETRYSDRINVAESVFNGNVVYGLKHYEAIEKGLIPRAEYICSIFDQDDIYKRYKNKNISEELFGRLEFTLRNSLKISECLTKHIPENPKGIVFVDRIKSIDKTIDLINSIFPELPLFSISSCNDKKQNMSILNKFKKSKTGLIINVGMLGEGIHLDDINTLIMLRKTCSSTVYIQQLGRALSIGSRGVTIFDFVGNSSSINISAGSIVSDYNTKERNITELQKFSDQFILYNYAKDIVDVLKDIDIMFSCTLWTEEEDDILREYYPTIGIKVVDMLPRRSKASVRARVNYISIKSNSRSKHWTEEEDNILRKYYPTMGTKVIDMLPGRTKHSVVSRAASIGIKIRSSTCKHWTKEEDDIIREYYPTMASKVVDMLPGRSKDSVVVRAGYIGVKFNSNKWTEEEDNILREYYPTMASKVADMLPGRSKDSVMTRAASIGINGFNKWTEDEDNILREYYPTIGTKVIDMLPGRTKASVVNRAGCIGVYSGGRKWTKEEDNILREYYPTIGIKVVDMLPGRSKKSILARSRVLMIANRREVWTEEEDDIIRKYYPNIGSKVIDMLPGRTRYSVQSRVVKLGVRVCNDVDNK